MFTPESILEFWFSGEAPKHWFDSTRELEQLVVDRFLPVWQAATNGELAAWESTPQGALALVIVLDQFPLNMFRGRPESFSTEAQARQVTLRALEAGYDRELEGAQKAFLYIPLMHSESLADQELSVALYEAAGLTDSLKWAYHHRDLIRRYGRFPHRNAILGRESTPEEIAYLNSDEAFHG